MSNEVNPLLSGLKGLSSNEVGQSREKYGHNTLTPPKKTSLWTLYLEKYKDPIIKILILAACISLALAFIEGEFIETIGIFVAIFMATTIGFYFERDAAKKFEVLNAVGEEQPVKVKRDGKIVQIPRHEVVVGDVVIIEVGDEIPADGDLMESTDLQVDESTLTGEPIVTKHADPKLNDAEVTYPSNKVLRGTMVMNGRGVFTVTAVGDATEIGTVARASTEITAVKTPLNMQLEKLAKMISKVGIGISVAAFVIFLGHDILTDPKGIWHTTNYLAMAETVLGYFMMAVTLIVMAVPEGMPMAVTLSLALNMRRMLKNNNLVRKLHACETMGAVTVICTDKTGTLTQNKMQVADMTVYDKDRQLLDTAIALNSTAHLDESGQKGIGNPTEVALLLWLHRNGADYRALRGSLAVETQLPFSTERKYMATVARVNGQRYLFMKGAPEIVSACCALADDSRQQVSAVLRGYQNKAMRTLAFACKPLADGENADLSALNAASALTLQAVAAISDPVRADVPGAVKECLNAGITVKIVTGDTSATAIEIARQIGIWDKDTPAEAQITGPDFAALSDEEAYKRVMVLQVMSRARPTDKQRLVNLLQQNGQVVAVTGDGTNDAPALNHAHVGLSLGSGTSVAKQASDMTLIDDSFGSIVNAVMWGRSLYRNIQRFIFFQLIVNVTALLLVLSGSVLGTEMPLTVTQILWVNIIMDTFAALALASLPPSREVMNEKPRKRTDFIITKPMIKGIVLIGVALFALLFYLMLGCYKSDGGMDLHELTIFFTAFVMFQFWNLFNAKCLGSNHSAFDGLLRDKGLLLVLLLILVGQWFIVTFGGRMFRTTPLGATEWLEIIVATSIVLWLGEIWRGIKRWRCKE